MSTNSSFKDFSYVSIGRIIAIVLQAILYLFFAALLEPDSYGELNYIIALAGTFALFSRYGLNYTVIVYQAKKNSEISDKINTLAVVTSSFAAVILLTIDMMAALLSLGLSFYLMNQSNLLGLKKYKAFMINAILRGLIILVIPILLYFYLDIPGIVLGFAISNLLASNYFLRKIKLVSFWKIKNHFSVMTHNFGADASTNLSRMVDKLFIANLFGFFIVGVFQFNMQVLFVFEVLPTVLYNFLLSEESSGRSHKKISLMVIFGAIVLAVLGIIFSPFFVQEFFPSYTDGIDSLQILLVSIIPLSVTAVLNAKIQAAESTLIGFSAVIRIGSLLVLIILLGELYGLVGLSLAVLLSIIFNTVFTFFLYSKLTKKTF